MLKIIHGADTALSRKQFLSEKQKYKDAVLLDAEQVNLTDLTQIFEGGGLFGETKYLFIEQYLTKKKKNSDFKTIITYIEKYAALNTIVLWENKELDRSTLNELKQATVNVFKLPQTLFQLLDALYPNNHEKILKLFHKTIETTETEMVFFMLVRQIRILLAASIESSVKIRDNEDSEQIDELKRLSPWQKVKIEKQAHTFDKDHLLGLYNKLFRIEIGQKTGLLSIPLVSAIDFFLLSV